MPLTAAAGESVAQVQAAATANAQYLIGQAELFLTGTVDAATDFRSVGDFDELNYLQWDYDGELAGLTRLTPGYLQFDGTAIDGEIDQIGGVAVPAAPTLTLPTATMPTLDAERPVIVMPDLPDTAVGDAPSDEPTLTDVAVPDSPVFALPNVPTFEELQLPVAPSFSLPSFSSAAPVDTLVAPTSEFSFVDAEYSSALRDPAVAKLLGDLVNGGYGIEPGDELLLWARARDRAEQAGRAQLEEAMGRAAATGMPLPQASIAAGIDRARQALQAELSKANADIALKRADMYVENRKFTIQQVAEYEKIYIDLHNATQERALNAAKAVAEIGIALFDASVRRFSAQLEAHKVEAQVFETRVRAELSKAELFKAQIEAEALRGQFNAQRVALYQAQLNGVQTVANLYKTRVEAAGLLADIQAQRVEVFKSRVQAFTAKVQAKAAEFGMYRAAVDGQAARMDIYKTDIAAFETRVRAEESRIRALTAGNDALVEQYKAQIAQYDSQLTGVTKKVDARLDRDKTYVATAGVNAQVYRALSDAVLAGVSTRVEAQKMNNVWNMAALDSKVAVTKNRLEQLKLTVENVDSVNRYGTKFYGDMTTSLLGSISGLTTKAA